MSSPTFPVSGGGGGGGEGTSDHNLLTNKDAANQHPAASIAPVTTNFNKNLSAADDTVQKALETLDDLSASGGTAATTTMLIKTGASYDDVQDWANIIQSSGRISGGDISAHSPANGAVDVSALKGFIKYSDSEIGETRFFDLAAATSVALTDNATNYIYVDYNAGTPQVVVTTDRTTIKLTNQFTLGRAFRSGNDVEVLQSGINVFNRTRKVHERWIDTFGGVSYANGITVSATGLKPAITAGTLYAGSNKISIAAKDCNTSGTFDSYYWNPTTSAWVITTGQTSFDATNYNKTDTGTGLSALTANKYGVHWLYVCPDGDLYVLYGKGDYTLTQAQTIPSPTSPIPNYLSQWAKLAAKVIVQKSATSLYSITMAWSTQFPVQNPGDHNALAGLQGGTTDQYYHLIAPSAGDAGKVVAIKTDGSGYENVSAKRSIFLSLAGGWTGTTLPDGGFLTTETSTNKVNFKGTKFAAAATDGKHEFGCIMPGNYDGGTITAKAVMFVPTSTDASSHTIIFGLQGVAFADGDAGDTAYGTAQEVTFTAAASLAGKVKISADSSAITIANTPAANKWTQFRCYRKGDDTYTGDVTLLGWIISYGINKYSDA